MNWFIEVLKKPLEFRGRARRKEYWYFFAVSVVITLVLTLIDQGLGWYNSNSAIGILSGVFSLFIILPSLSVTVRRLHDMGRTGWWVLLFFVPVAGFFIILCFLAFNGTAGANKYGDNPRSVTQV